MGVPESYLRSDFNWVSNDFMAEFRERVKEKTKDAQIAYHVGRGLMSPSNINPFEFALLKAIPAILVLWLISYNTRKLSRVSSFRLLRLRPGLATIILSSFGEVKHSVDICNNTIGVLEGIKEPTGLDSITVSHKLCVHRGAKDCIFEVRYRSHRRLVKQIFNAVAMFGLMALVNVLADRVRPDDNLFHHLVLAFSIFSFMAILAAFKIAQVLKHYGVHNEQNIAKDYEIFEKRSALHFKGNESELLHELAVNLNQESTTHSILAMCLKQLKERFGYSTCMVMLLNENEKRLHTHQIIGFENQELSKKIYGVSIQYPNVDADSPDLFAHILDQNQVRLVANIDQFKSSMRKPENKALVEMLGVNSLIVSPMRNGDLKYGLLIVGRFGGEESLTEDDRALIEKITQLLTLTFKNAFKLEKEKQLKNLFKKYVPAIVLNGIDESQSFDTFAPKNMNIASIFVDLRDFTKIAESLDPTRIRQMLSLYTNYVTKIFAETGGFIDKITGDGVNAFYIEKENEDIPAKRAMTAGLRLLREADSLRSSFLEMGFPEPRFGVGINTGPAIVGAFGSEHKLEFAALGDTVNTASRFQALCKDFAEENDLKTQSLMVCAKKTLEESGAEATPVMTQNRAIRGKAEFAAVCLFTETSLAAEKKQVA